VETVEELVDQLKNSTSEYARLKAVTALGSRRDTRAVAPLADYLKTCPPENRWRVIRALGKLGDARAVEHLLPFLGRKFIFSRGRATAALEKIAKNLNFAPFVKALKHDKHYIRRAAAKILDKNGWKPSNDRELARYLIAMGKWLELLAVGKEAVKPLIDTLDDEKKSIRINAVKTLGDIGDRSAVAPLIGRLNYEKQPVSDEIMQALDKTREAGITKPFVKALRHKNRFVRQAVANIFERYPMPAKKLEGNEEHPTRERAIKALKDQNANVRGNAAEALGKIGDLQALDPLIDALKDKNTAVRVKAAEALGTVGNSRAVKPLLKITLKGLFRKKLQKAAKNALEEISPRLIHDEVDFVCERCFLRYQAQTAAFLNIYTFRSAAVTCWSCPKCQSDSYYLIGVDKVILLLDHGFEDIYAREEAVLTVNWFKKEAPFDYDEIRIIDADDYEVEKLVMSLINDMDDQRRERLPEIPVYLSPGLKISQAKMNLLKDNFKSIVED
jgi:HEAT repeat protein